MRPRFKDLTRQNFWIWVIELNRKNPRDISRTQNEALGHISRGVSMLLLELMLDERDEMPPPEQTEKGAA